MSRSQHVRFGSLVSVALLTVGIGITAPVASASADEAICETMTAPIYRTTNPDLDSNLLTQSESEYLNSQTRYGFVEDEGILGYAASGWSAGARPVMRMYNRGTADFMWAVGSRDVLQAKNQGFAVEQINFFAPTTEISCGVPVHRYERNGSFRVAVGDEEQAALAAEGWNDQGVVFYVRPAEDSHPESSPEPSPEPEPTAQPTQDAPEPSPEPEPTAEPTREQDPQPAPPAAPDPVDGTFSIAVIPDTQTEVVVPNDQRLPGRTQWLVDNAEDLGLAYVLHTGDITNWGWKSPEQMAVAQRATANLDAAGIPYAFAIGNHDTAAVGQAGGQGSRTYGGGAYVNNPECVETYADNCKTWKLIRNTEEFNRAFPVTSFTNVGGAFEQGKVDNMWTTFQAGGTNWLVVTLEMYPRQAAVEWAGNVVATHPDHNVIVQTHAYMSGWGGIDGSNGGYGSTSGRYLYDNLIKVYPNIKMVFSGHTGASGSRVDTGVNGNTIVSYLGTYHHNTTNPVRIVTIDVASGQVTTKVVAPHTNQTFAGDTTTHQMSFIK